MTAHLLRTVVIFFKIAASYLLFFRSAQLLGGPGWGSFNPQPGWQIMPTTLLHDPQNYSFLNLEIVENSNSCWKISIFYLVHWMGEIYTGKYGTYLV